MGMNMISDAALTQEVGRLLAVLYDKRFGALKKLSLARLLNKNPYLYRALGISDSSEFIMQLMIAFVSSSDETIFGNDFFEPLAIFAARQGNQHEDADRRVTVGAGAGQDIAIETANSYLAISVKSGKNIFNSQSTKGQAAEFTALTSRLRKLNKELRAIIGYGYGRKRQVKASNVEKIAGQAFWQLLCDGVDAISDIPANRWSLANFYDADRSKASHTYVKWGGFLDDLDGFDAQFFGRA